jgi:aspartokinase/homoserine dehydrogenase 1
MKFGGTSVGSSERMKVACDLISLEAARRPVVAVVSAMSKITDLLLDTSRHAEGGDQTGVDRGLEQLETRHRAAAKDLVPAAELSRVESSLAEIIADFRRIVNGMLMLAYRPPRAVDEAIAVGERLSAVLISEHLLSRGIPAEAVNACAAIVTDALFNNASPLMAATKEKASARILPLLNAGIIPIVTGFNGATADGRPTTLGRGGSDFSASILAAALNAAELWIWTDVDGIMTADPRLVPDARILDEITYSEAAELAYAGAKVLHPRTLAPLVERGIPVWSKNSFAPEKPGTRIVPKLGAGNSGARAVTSMANVALVSLEPANAAVGGVHIMARSLDALDRANVEILAISSSSYRQSFCFLVRKEELQRATEAIEAALALELAHGYVKGIDADTDVGLLAVVGEGMRGFSGLAGRIFTAISREHVNIIAIAQGSSELTISIVVRRDGLEKAVRAVHAECHL